jgi:hypothetical protein
VNVQVAHLVERPGLHRYHGRDLAYREWVDNRGGERHVIEIEGVVWPNASPEECTDETLYGDWYEDATTGRQYLLCRGCGLDCT